MPKEGKKDNNKQPVPLRLDESQIRALEYLEPGLGNSANEVIRFIITDWINKNMGINWMKEKGLIK